MAEAVAKRWFAEKLECKEEELSAKGLIVRSGGLTDAYEKQGSPASAHGITALVAKGYDLSQHRSTVLNSSQMIAAHSIYCVSKRHVDVINSETAGRVSRCITLGQDIPDPWHGPLDDYEEAANTIERAVPEVLEQEWSAGIFTFITDKE